MLDGVNNKLALLEARDDALAVAEASLLRRKESWDEEIKIHVDSAVEATNQLWEERCVYNVLYRVVFFITFVCDLMYVICELIYVFSYI